MFWSEADDINCVSNQWATSEQPVSNQGATSEQPGSNQWATREQPLEGINHWIYIQSIFLYFL